MSMKYSKSISFSACLLTLTGLYGCQSAQQKVYQQASNMSSEYHSVPRSDQEPFSSEYQNHNQYLPEPAPAPVGNELPPAAPPSLTPPQSKRQIDNKRQLILKTSTEEFASDQAYFQSEFSSDFEEPAEKHLGLVPHYSSVSSSVSQKVKQMNGKVKNFCSNMKTHLKSPRWISKISGSYVQRSESEVGDCDLSCIESIPFVNPESIESAPLPPIQKHSQPVFPEPLHSHPKSKPLPVQPQPKLEKRGLPELPLPQQTEAFQKSTWKVSASLEQLPERNYSTPSDQLELWPYSKQKMLQEIQVKQFRKIKTATPVSTPRQFKSQDALNHPRNLSVPSMLTQDEVNSIRKISLQQIQNEKSSNFVETLKEYPIVISPR